jgi:hypothetical protein
MSKSANVRKQRDKWRSFFFVLCGLCGFLAPECVMAKTPQAVDKSAENLMVVLRESVGANKQDEALLPMTKARVKLSDGKEVDFEMAAFALIGDIHIRFVFDGPSYMPNAKPQDLARLNLNAEQALQLAVDNIKRVYGDPVAKPWTGGLMQVEGKSPDFDSSYFLDRAFWQGLLRHWERSGNSVPEKDGVSLGIYELREGSNWTHAARALIAELEAHWPGKVQFKDGRGRIILEPYELRDAH